MEALTEASPRAVAADHRILACLPKGKRESFVEALHQLARAGEKAQAKVDKSAAVSTEDAEAAPKPKKAKADKAGGKKKKKARKAEKADKPEKALEPA